jgi:multiple sugar transport system permease protein
MQGTRTLTVARRSRKQLDAWRGGLWRALLFLVISLFTAIVLLPFLWMLFTSLKTEASIVTFPPRLLPDAITFEHYLDIWRRIDFARLFLNTVIFAGGVTVISLLFDSLTAYALARLDFPGRNALLVVVLVTLMLPFQVTLVPLFKLLADLGWINTFAGLILPRATNAFGIFFLRQFFLTIPRDLEDAARVDGAGELRIFFRIVLPLSVPPLLVLGFFHLMYNWNDLIWPLVVAGDTQTQTLPAGLALFMGEHVVEYGLLMAGAILALAPMIIGFLFVQRRFVEGIATTGLK